jgi:predicted RNase H-like nuclease (RuvC/YqgF family)
MTAAEYQGLIEFLACRSGDIERRVEQIARRVDLVDRRLEAFQQEFREHAREVLGHFDQSYRRLERLERESRAITRALRRIEGLLADEKGRRAILERSLEELKRYIPRPAGQDRGAGAAHPAVGPRFWRRRGWVVG